MQEVLVEVTRGPLVENVLRGSVAVVDGSGALCAALGEPEYLTYMRSSAKPLQASAAVECGAIDHFSIAPRELAVMCGSHNGEDCHVEAVQSILDKLGLTEDAFTLGPVLSLSRSLERKRLADHVAPRKIFNNCSGKHSCMLAMCRFFGWSIEAYQKPDHPVQVLIRRTVAEYAHLRPEDLVIGVDGCGVPVFGMPLSHMALAFRDLTTPEKHLSEPRASAARRITEAMTAYPEMVGGTGVFCTALLGATKGRLVGKLGADGVYCIGVRNGDLGLAVKIESGVGAGLPIVLVHLLKQLELLTAQEEEALSGFAVRYSCNWQQEQVGLWRPAFRLER